MTAQTESREQRAARYRKMAAEAEALAAQSRFPDTRIEYQKLAKAWRSMAESTEREP